MTADQTPARRQDAPLREGCHVLERSDVGHYDGGEDEVRAILERATDRSSLSDELSSHDRRWETRYHFAKERANVLRPLALAADATVLEVGAGCGAVTRYLGERCALVDAVEPTSERAEIARLRTADLPGVEVFVGSLDAIPAEPAYDAIVLVGVLEYVGGRDGHEERLRTLREAAARLRPGGAVVCAIENRLGVQYLAGAPEEHLGLPFAGLEGYPADGPARTFSRRELQALFTEAGLAASVHHVFPDYKFARLVYADSLLETAAAPLAWRAPAFPSNASPHPRPRLVDEGRLWRGLVEAGLGGELANSFLVVAGAQALPELWPRDVHAAFYSTSRRAAFATETTVRGGAERPALDRCLLGSAGPAAAGSLEHRVSSGHWVEGPSLLETLEEADESALAAWLGRWREAVEAAPDDVTDIDLVPHNLIVAGERLVPVDREWFDSSYTPSDVVDRGILHLGLALADRRPPESWPGAPRTVTEVVGLLARLAEDPCLVERLDAIVAREAQLLVRISRLDDPARGPRWVEDQAEAFRDALARPLAATGLGPRPLPGIAADDRLAELVAGHHAELEHLHREVAARDAEVERLHGEVAARDSRVSGAESARAEAELALARIHRSRSWRSTGALRRFASGVRAALAARR